MVARASLFHAGPPGSLADLKQEGIKFLAAGLAAAALLTGSPAEAGVEFVKPETKKVPRSSQQG
jgi:hypothetical protein